MLFPSRDRVFDHTCGLLTPPCCVLKVHATLSDARKAWAPQREPATVHDARRYVGYVTTLFNAPY